MARQVHASRTVVPSAALCLLGVALGACGGEGGGSGSFPQPLPIPAGAEPVSIAGGEIHFRDFDLRPGEFLQVVAEQRGVDLVLRLHDPHGRLLVEVDSPNGKQGVEELVAIADEAGIHRFEVVAGEGAGAAGEYAFRVEARRAATAQDREVVAADRAYREGGQLLDQSKPREAVAELQHALAAWARLGLERRTALTSWRLYSAYRALGDLDLALIYCSTAAERAERSGDLLLAAEAYRLAGWLSLQLGEPEQAIPPLLKARSLFEGTGARGWYLSTANLAAAHHALGEIQRSLSLFEEALGGSRAAEDAGAEASVLSDLGGLLLDLNRPQEALAGYSRALEIHRRLGKAHHAGIALTGLAGAALQAGDLDRAESGVREALDLLPAAATHDRIIALMTLGRTRRRQGDLRGARRDFEQALELAVEIDDQRSQGTALLEIGYVHLESGDPARALELEDQAFDLFRRLGDAVGQASARIRGAEALRDLGRHEAAWERLRPALDTIEELRGETLRSDLRLQYFAFRQEYYEIAIDLLMRRHEADPAAGLDALAFAVNERRLARDLLETLGAEPSDRPRLPARTEQRQSQLEEELRTAATAWDLEGLEREERIRELTAELHRVRGEALRVSRGAAGSRVASAVTLEDARGRLLDEDSLLLVYALGERRSFLWAVSRQAVTVHSLPPRRTLESLAHRFVSRLVERRRSGGAIARELGRELSGMLLGPVATRLGGRRLVVVGEGALQALPFAALPSPAGAGEDEFLVQDHEVVVLPSVTALEALRRSTAGRPRSPPRIAAFSDPVLTRSDARLRGLAGHRGEAGQPAVAASVAAPDRASSGGSGTNGGALDSASVETDVERSARGLGTDPFARLTHAGEEADAILSQAPGSGHWMAQGFDANREAVLSPRIHRYSVLHFATHALLHPDHPELSGIVLSLVDPAGRPRDGFLRAFEIARLDLGADLVVLSACETGVGRDLRGEGMLSLARSFFAAGVPRVVATLWRVSDRRTVGLIERFYEAYLRRRLPPAAALRWAQRAALEEEGTADPYAWAGFVFYGDWEDDGERGRRWKR